MKRCLLFSVLALWAAGASAQAPRPRATCESPPFEEGEMARFVARVGTLKVGEGTAILRKAEAPSDEMPPAGDLPDREMWQLEGRAISTPPVSFFYKVDDSIKVWMQQQDSLLPHRQEIRIDETNERADIRVIYDHAAGIAHFWRDRTFYRRNPHREKVTVREHELIPESFEPISLLFYLRCIDATEGSELELPVHESGKNRTVRVVVEEIETIKTPLGEKEAIRARIEVSFEGRLENKRPFKAWVTNDERRIPLRFVADLKFANLKGVLVAYRRHFGAEIEGELDPHFVDGRATD